MQKCVFHQTHIKEKSILVLMAVSHLPLQMFHDLMLIYHLLMRITRLLVLLTPCQLKLITHPQTIQAKCCSQTKAAVPQQTMCFQSQGATPSQVPIQIFGFYPEMENQLNGSKTHESQITTLPKSFGSKGMLGMDHKALAKLVGRWDVDCDIVRRIGRGIGQVNSNGVELGHIQLVNKPVLLCGMGSLHGCPGTGP